MVKIKHTGPVRRAAFENVAPGESCCMNSKLKQNSGVLKSWGIGRPTVVMGFWFLSSVAKHNNQILQSMAYVFVGQNANHINFSRSDIPSSR